MWLGRKWANKCQFQLLLLSEKLATHKFISWSEIGFKAYDCKLSASLIHKSHQNFTIFPSPAAHRVPFKTWSQTFTTARHILVCKLSGRQVVLILYLEAKTWTQNLLGEFTKPYQILINKAAFMWDRFLRPRLPHILGWHKGGMAMDWILSKIHVIQIQLDWIWVDLK